MVIIIYLKLCIRCLFSALAAPAKMLNVHFLPFYLSTFVDTVKHIAKYIGMFYKLRFKKLVSILFCLFLKSFAVFSFNSLNRSSLRSFVIKAKSNQNLNKNNAA